MVGVLNINIDLCDIGAQTFLFCIADNYIEVFYFHTFKYTNIILNPLDVC